MAGNPRRETMFRFAFHAFQATKTTRLGIERVELKATLTLDLRVDSEVVKGFPKAK